MNLRFFMIAIIALMATLSSADISAGKPYTDPYKEYDEVDHWDLELDDNILVPAVSDGERKDVRKYMRNLLDDLKKRNYNVDSERDDEVVVITLPCSRLFLPNDTLLWTRQASALLDPLKPLLADPDLFKVIFSVNSDNTGSEMYNTALSDARKDSMYEWFDQNAAADLIVVPYSMGDADPIATNGTRAGREANRRVEIYLIPGPKIIELAHTKRLLK